MRVLVVGDIHLTHRNLPRSKMLLTRILEVIEEKQPDAVVLLGDVFDTHRTIYIECATIFSQFVSSLPDSKKLYHIVGNHEMADSLTVFPENHAVTPYKDRINVIDKPSLFTWGNTEVLMLPYTPVGKFMEAVGSFEPNLIFCHQEFTGAEMRAGIKSENGDLYAGNAKVISGHIHGTQLFNNIWYPGTPCQHTFDESPEKYIHLIEVVNGDYKVLEAIDLNMPKLITLTVSYDVAHELIDQIQSNPAHYRVVIEGSKQQLKSIKNSDWYETLHKNAKIKLSPVEQDAVRKEIIKAITFKERLKQLSVEQGIGELCETIFE